MNIHIGHNPYTLGKLFIRNTWKYISRLGIDEKDNLPETRSYILSNKLNFIMAVAMATLGIILFIRLIIIDRAISLGYMRVWYTFGVCVLNLVLARYKLNSISKISLIFLPVFVFLVMPVLLGFVQEESLFYSAFVLIAASIIPQLILNSEKEKALFRLSMLYYFLLVLSIDYLAFKLSSEDFALSDYLEKYFFVVKLAHIMIFLFINVCIYNLRRINFKFEERLNAKNQILNDQNEKLESNSRKILLQKEIIEQHAMAVTDSINYAGMIQQAVLQPPDFLNEWGLSSFVLYKPKAVVSGDFYWGAKSRDTVIVVAADCTGHGVPGAFMSMLGLAFLDDLYNNEEKLSAAGFLDRLRDLIINKLNKKGATHEVKDGMDISICLINRKEKTLEFAGANNPLYVIREGNLIKVPADKMPIGIYSATQNPFKNNEMELKKNDRLYLFSDGYADQFGGKFGKKLMYNQFQDLLLEHHKKPMGDQKTILDEFFEKWRGDHVQIDDVLVMGIQI
jgi:serine phosphatase RsbU (regulator of sigma subunit)